MFTTEFLYTVMLVVALVLNGVALTMDNPLRKFFAPLRETNLIASVVGLDTVLVPILVIGFGLLLGVDDVLPEVPDIVTQIIVEARFDDGTRLVVIQQPFGTVDRGSGTGIGNTTPPPPQASAQLEVTNMANTPIGITSHIHLAEVNPRLRLDRSRAYGMRPAHQTGMTVWIEAGDSVTIPVTPIEGDRVMIGNTGVINGSLDDPELKRQALSTLRDCGYLDVVDGNPVNSPEEAHLAVAALMGRR